MKWLRHIFIVLPLPKMPGVYRKQPLYFLGGSGKMSDINVIKIVLGVWSVTIGEDCKIDMCMGGGIDAERTGSKKMDMTNGESNWKDVETVLERVEEIRAAAGLKQLQEDLAALEAAATDSALWDNRATAQETLQALTDCKDKLKLLHDFKTQADDAETIIKLTEEMESIDSALLQEASGIIKELNKALDRFELTQLLSGPYDKEAAVITITAGAGGTDAQDWADMLLRMYVRWGEKQRYETKVVEKSVGEEAGIKSATIEIEGRYAYGYLSGEKGTHRIVRQSPFNAKGLRQQKHLTMIIITREVTYIIGPKPKYRVRSSIKYQFTMNPHNSIIGTYSLRHALHRHLDVMKNKLVVLSHCHFDVTEYELRFPHQWWPGGYE
ncbi:Peptide chain release factor 2 [Capsicum annuum]|nr:Peptide chain release factor 2 [Capsicum annuum]